MNKTNFLLNKPIAHRGIHYKYIENTLPAFILSKEKGFNYVECDVSFTSDGIPVLLHDETIDRTSNGSGRVSNLTYNQLLQYDFGNWKSSEYAGTKIPTFEEFIVLCKNIGLHPNIELKDNGNYTQEQILEIVDIVKNCGMKGNVTYVSFNINYLNYVKAYDKQARLGYVMFDITQDKINEALNLKSGLNDVFITASYTNLTDAKIQMCIDNGLPLEMWSVNDADVIKSMNSYISGVTSDSLIASQILSGNYGINSEETDPTVPQHVKNITQADIAKWNSGTGGSGGSGYEPNIMTIVNRGKQTLTKEQYNKVIFNDVLSSVGDKLELTFSDGKANATITEIFKEN
jgi:glycerophosphoryl diester phosphodiesterase